MSGDGEQGNQNMYKITGYIAALSLLTASADMLAGEITSSTIYSTQIIQSLAPIQGQVIANRAIDLDIRFSLGSAKLSSKARAQLNELGKALTSEQLKLAHIGIYGHTDSRGSARSNLILSQKRAQSVLNYLLKNFTINKHRLAAKGFGEERLKNPIAPKAAANRRVEIANLGSERDVFNRDGTIQW